MKKINIIIAIICIISVISMPYTIKCYGNTVDSISKEKIERLLNDSLLSENYKKSLALIKEKIDKRESLVQEEVELIQRCEQEIIIKKIGEEIFEEYRILIDKRKNNKEFTQEERYRIYEIEKQIKEYK